MTSEQVKQKALRLLRESRVSALGGPAHLFQVRGDSGLYLTVISPTVRLCTCDHGRHAMTDPTMGDCSHIEAALVVEQEKPRR